MKKLSFLLAITPLMLFAQQMDVTRAPNSYIFNLPKAIQENHGGILIPVEKAYAMWNSYEYLKNDQSNAMPIGEQSGELIWEDKPGLINHIEVLKNPNPSLSKIKVDINKGLGNGNAVVGFKINDEIYWSWHIWVTDDPSNGVTYSQGFEMDKNGKRFDPQYMDRNLGASTSHFLGDNWHKSGGLLYQWGRKDPFPGLVYKDLNFYSINSYLGDLTHSSVSGDNIPVILRPFNNIEDNISYSVKNPLTYIINSDKGNWFSNQLHKVAGDNYEVWDLWSDNTGGKASNGSSSNQNLKFDSNSYELKSPLDPCPSGWRVPSHYSRVATNSNLGPWGRKNYWQNDDTNGNAIIAPDGTNQTLAGIKVYPGFGMDFTNAQNGSRNIGVMPITGNYEYYPNSVSRTAKVGIIYQDENSDGSLWSASFAYDGARVLGLLSDPASKSANASAIGLHGIYINQTNTTKTGNAVRCMRDPNLALIGNFETEYFKEEKENFNQGIDHPNSYIVTKDQVLRIPVNKAFAVYNQLLSDKEMLPSHNLVAKVMWTTNPNTIKSISLQNKGLNSEILVDINASERGNAVVSLHQGSVDNPAYWSWHIWVPDSDPTSNKITYLTETPLTAHETFINPTKSLAPPLVTTFMDRNLGAISAVVDEESSEQYIKDTKGLQYQWGRKDPIPVFHSGRKNVNEDHFIIYTGKYHQTSGNASSYNTLNNKDYTINYTTEFNKYSSNQTKEYKRTREHILYSVQNPLTFLYHQGQGKIFDGGDHYSNDVSQVRDWASDQTNQAYERWGHGGSKSPFDPCPEGWRVPDVSTVILYSGSKGNSPFYHGFRNDWTGKPGVIQDQWASITNTYQGKIKEYGYLFGNSEYPIGSFSKDGIRGELGGNALSSERTGVWLAALSDLNKGFALGMLLNDDKMQTATGVYPQAAMSVRCAKDEARYLGVPVSYTNTEIDFNAKNEVLVVGGTTSSSGNMYPNPFINELFYTGEDATDFQLYDMGGKLVDNGKIINGKLDIGQMISGIYIVKIKHKNGSVITKKVIKN